MNTTVNTTVNSYIDMDPKVDPKELRVLVANISARLHALEHPRDPDVSVGECIVLATLCALLITLWESCWGRLG